MFDLVDALPAGRYDFVRLCPARDNETQQGIMGTRQLKRYPFVRLAELSYAKISFGK